MEFENFLRETYDDNRYSYCMLKCEPSVPHRQLKAIQVKDNRIPRNMGWNWKLDHAEVNEWFKIGEMYFSCSVSCKFRTGNPELYRK